MTFNMDVFVILDNVIDFVINGPGKECIGELELMIEQFDQIEDIVEHLLFVVPQAMHKRLRNFN